MFLRFRWFIVAGFIIFLLSANVNSLQAQDLPVPGQTELVKQERQRIAGQEFEFTYYTSVKQADQIKSFYRNTLTKSGWKEKSLLKDLEQVPNFKPDAALTSALEQNLIFEKDELKLIITILPDAASSDKKTRFNTCLSKIDFQSAASSADEFSPPELLAKPTKDVAPEYPGASLTSLSETEGSLTATYFTKDSIDEVSSFYRHKMLNYGWVLIEEKPVQKIERDCPTCPKTAQAANKPIEMLFGELVFSNERKDSCTIGFSYVSGNKDLDSSFSFTTIIVDYYEEKK